MTEQHTIDDGPPLIPGIDVFTSFSTPRHHGVLIFDRPQDRTGLECRRCGHPRGADTEHQCLRADGTSPYLSGTYGQPDRPEPVDIIDRIDELVDEQLQQEASGYDHNINQEQCWHCGRHWHGLPITEHIAWMYSVGRYDPEYLVDEDDSPIVCHGSEFIGPRKPGRWERRPANMVREVRDIGMFITIRPDFDMSGWHEAIDRARESFQQLMERATAQFAAGQLWQLPDDPFDVSGWFQTVDVSSWFRTPEQVEPCTLPGSLIKVEFGPQNWHHELTHLRQPLQFSRHYGQYPMDPLSRAIRGLPWTAEPPHPIPASPGYDFSRYDTLINDDSPGWNGLPAADIRPPRTAGHPHTRRNGRRAR